MVFFNLFKMKKARFHAPKGSQKTIARGRNCLKVEQLEDRVTPSAIKLSNIPADTVGVPYNQSITATGGTGAITLAVSNIQNAVPGLNVPGSGTGSLNITGTPTAAGTETFTVTATDTAGDTTTANYSTATTINFDSGLATHLVGGDPDEYTSYTQGGFIVSPNVAVDGAGAHFHMDSTGMYTHIHNDEPGGPGVIMLQRADGGKFVLDSLVVPQLTSGGSLTFADSAGDTMTVTATGTYTFNWGPITSFSITPNNLVSSLDQRGYVNDIVVNSLSNYSLAVDPAVTLTPAPLPADTVNTAYNQTIAVYGGTGLINLTVSNVQHPIPGLTVPSNGIGALPISGTPTAAGTETFTVTATDALGATATTNYSITVDKTAITLSNITADTVGVPYNQSITASGGTGSITLTVSNIQNVIPGLNVPSSGTGSLKITGTPTAAGNETFTVTATDTAGDTTTATYSTVTTINFDSGAATHLAGGDPDEYTSYTQSGFTLSPDVAVDGAGAHFHLESVGLYTHIHDDEPGGPGVILLQRSDGGPFILDSLVVPQLSSGGSLTFSDSAGDAMTVTATGTYQFNWGPISSFSITPNNLLDSLDQRGYVDNIMVNSLGNYSLAVDPAVTFTPAPLPADTVNTAYNQTIAVYGGTGLISLAVSNVQHPIAGLTLPSSGIGALPIGGTPTAAGTETFTVTATDALGAMSTTNYSITVNKAAITLNNIPNATVGLLYDQSIAASGGTGTITLSVSNIQGTVPGLNIPISGTGSLNISGIPTAAGTETFTVTATDTAGDTTTATYSTATTINFDSGSATHLVGGDPDEYTSYTQGGFIVSPDVAVDGAGAHFHMDSTGLYTHIHDDEPGGPGVVQLQRSDGGVFILDSLVVPQLTSGGSLTFADSAGDTMTVTAAGTYQFNWGPISSFSITPNNLLDSLDQRGYVDNIMVNSLSNYSLTADPVVTLSPAPLPADTVNTAYNQTIAVYGGTGLINLAVSNVQHAIAGLTVPSSGIGALPISGTPTAAGTETFTVTATDALGATATTNYSITVNNNAITLSNIPAATVGVPYNQSITASGGTGTITLTVSNIQNVIPGLNVPSSGTGSLKITGTPTAAGNETFTVTATDTAGDTTTATYSTTTTINFDSGPATHLVGGDPDEYTSYTQGGFIVSPDVAVDGAGAHFHMDSTGLYTHIHDDEPGGAGVVQLQRSDGGVFILDSLVVPQLTSGGSLTFADSAGDTMTVTAPGTYQFNWGPISSFSITPNNLLDSLDQRGYVNDIVVNSLSNYSLTADPVVTLSPASLPTDTVNTAYNQTIAVYGGTGLINLTVGNVQHPIPGLTVPSSGIGALPISGTPTAAGAETFTVTATDAVGAIATTNYTITANQTAIVLLPTQPIPPSPAGLSANTLYVAGLYRDLLGRQGAPNELSGWVNQLQAGVTRTQVAQDILHSTEYLTDEVQSYYQTFLNRPGESAGVAGWVSDLQAGATEQQVILAFLTSPEFLSTHTTSNSYVGALYNLVLQRTGGTGEVAGWTSLISNKTLTETQVAQFFLNSTEAETDVVNAYYLAMLARLAEPAGLAGWLSTLQAGSTLDSVLFGILGSAEYAQDLSLGIR